MFVLMSRSYGFYPYQTRKAKKKKICFQTAPEKKQCITDGYKRYGVTVVTVTVSQMDKTPNA